LSQNQRLVDILDQLDKEKARIYSLVLTARNIPHLIEVSSHKTLFKVKVEKDFEQIALNEIRLYCQENYTCLSKAPRKPTRFKNLKGSVISILILACVASVTFRSEVRDLLMNRWAADSSRIIEGETYRTVTSLFLHADPAHFFSNLFMAGLFFTILFEETGIGAGWFLIFCGAAAGNYLNALMFGYGHVSIGLSTAIFSCIGAYSALRAVVYKAEGAKDAFKVVLSGLALLGLLGTGEGRVDISAHFYGFVSGFTLGVVAGFLSRFVPVWDRFMNFVLGVAAVTVVLLSMVASLL